MTSPPSSTPITDLIGNLSINDTTIERSEDVPCLTYLGIQPQSFLVAKLLIKCLLPSIRIVAMTLSTGFASGRELRWVSKTRYENFLNNQVLGKDFVVCDVPADVLTVLGNRLLSQHDSYWKFIYHRAHLHMNMEERATPNTDINDRRDIIAITRSTPELIHILSKIGWVHRDLSPGNALSRSGNSKIAECEFVKEKLAVEESKTHDFRTGTRQFWSVEIEAGKLLHSPPSDGLQAFMGQFKQHPLRQLPLHDFESLWWIFAWVLLMRVPKNPSANWSETMHRRVLDEISPTGLVGNGRLDFLTGDPTLTLDVIKAIDEQLVPLLFNLMKFQSCLLSAFRRYEAALKGATGDDLAFMKAFWDYGPLRESLENSGNAFVDTLRDGLLDAFEVDQKHAKVLDIEMVDLPAIPDCDLFGQS